MKKVLMALASACALGASAQDAAVLVVNAAAQPDTARYEVYVSALDSRRTNREAGVRELVILPGQTSVTLQASEVDATPWHYYLVAVTPQGKHSVADVYRAPGETITIDVTGPAARATGTALTDSITVAQACTEAGMAALQAAREAKDEDAFNAAVAQVEKAVTEFIAAHPNSPGSIELMRMLPADNLEVAEALSEQARSAMNAPMYDLYMNSLKAQRQRKIQEEKVAEGKPAPEFSLPDPEGKMISLSSLKGKYVMLDFWGSWCGWCIKGIPQMKEQYERLKDKVEFVSVACNDSKEAWTGALEKYQMPWIQLWSDPSTPAPEQVSTLYAVSGYPTKFIIGPDGTIVKKVVGEDPSFYDLFDELLK